MRCLFQIPLVQPPGTETDLASTVDRSSFVDLSLEASETVKLAVKGGDPSFRTEKYLVSWVRLLRSFPSRNEARAAESSRFIRTVREVRTTGRGRFDLGRTQQDALDLVPRLDRMERI